MRQLGNRTLLEMDQVIHTGQLCVLSGTLDDISVDIKALNICLNIVPDPVACILRRIHPAFFRHEVRPLLRKERTVETRCNIGRHHGRLDRERTASAERIDKNPVTLPRSQHDKCCGKGLSDRRFRGQLAVASLMKGNAGGIESDRNLVF